MGTLLYDVSESCEAAALLSSLRGWGIKRREGDGQPVGIYPQYLTTPLIVDIFPGE